MISTVVWGTGNVGRAAVRAVEALADVVRAVRAGAVVVTPALYPLYDQRNAPPEFREPVLDAVRDGGGSLFVSGVDPGWGNDITRLAAEYAERYTLDHHGLDEEFWTRMTAHYTQAEIVELTMSIGSWLAFGRLNHVLGIDAVCVLPSH